MVFATDNDAGNKIMRDVYAAAAKRIPATPAEALQLRRQMRSLEKGGLQLGLDLGFQTRPVSDADLYEHVAPVSPPEVIQDLAADEVEDSEFEAAPEDPWRDET
jgi:hypothetical protein